MDLVLGHGLDRRVGQRDRSQHDDRVALEELDLRPLTPMLGVLDRHWVQPERALEVFEVGGVGVDGIDPYESAGLAGQRLHRVELERLTVRLPLSIDATRDHRGSLADLVATLAGVRPR